MRWLIIGISSIMIISNAIVGISLYKGFKSSEHTNSNQDEKVITVTIEIKDHLPIRSSLNVLDKYYVKLMKPKISLINLINNLPISNDDFDILALDLNQTISEDYNLLLMPWPSSIQYYNRYNVPLDVLINLGISNDDSKKILVLFNDKDLDSDQLLEKLKKILVTTKQKYIKLMHKFIGF
ncbi:hypothetical protein [Spiroplasma sp. AdecLV25b]|uniref:hypothetical protein n=1 Tax=Spiroplasma sp. AdecLV25b TaxID=3027162 RepID=UPI0027E05D2C|nr:hypothetical protein [Spiroplasma sp. AdecLV25b]